MDRVRGWTQAEPGDLAKSIVLEAAELLEHFQWDETLRLRGKEIEALNKEELSKEMADVMIYLIKLSDRLEIDLLKVTSEKIEEVKRRR